MLNNKYVKDFIGIVRFSEHCEELFELKKKYLVEETNCNIDWGLPCDNCLIVLFENQEEFGVIENAFEKYIAIKEIKNINQKSNENI